MKHDARSVANELIRRALAAGRPLTPLQVQKLVYFCHAWMLGLHGQPLLKQRIEAWQYGPAVRDIYDSLHQYGREPVTQPIQYTDDHFDEREVDLIDQVWEKYGGLSGPELSNMTHRIGSPWFQVWDRRNRAWWAKPPTVPNDLIREYYAWIAKGV